MYRSSHIYQQLELTFDHEPRWNVNNLRGPKILKTVYSICKRKSAVVIRLVNKGCQHCYVLFSEGPCELFVGKSQKSEIVV